MRTDTAGRARGRSGAAVHKHRRWRPDVKGGGRTRWGVAGHGRMKVLNRVVGRVVSLFGWKRRLARDGTKPRAKSRKGEGSALRTTPSQGAAAGTRCTEMKRRCQTRWCMLSLAKQRNWNPSCPQGQPTSFHVTPFKARSKTLGGRRKRTCGRYAGQEQGKDS